MKYAAVLQYFVKNIIFGGKKPDSMPIENKNMIQRRACPKIHLCCIHFNILGRMSQNISQSICGFGNMKMEYRILPKSLDWLKKSSF